jgi:hypothetical protein
MELCLGPLPVLQTLRGKEPFYRHEVIHKERVIVPWAGRRHRVWGFRFRRPGACWPYHFHLFISA